MIARPHARRPLSVFLHRLKDGSQTLIRPITPDDKARLQASFEQLGQDSRFRRFHGAKAGLSARELTYITEVDHHDHEALVAERAATGEILGVARFVRSPGEPALAEVGIAVVDHAQRQGIGRAVLERLKERAREVGITRFTGIALAHNKPILALFRELGTTTTSDAGLGTVEVTAHLPANRVTGALAHAA